MVGAVFAAVGFQWFYVRNFYTLIADMNVVAISTKSRISFTKYVYKKKYGKLTVKETEHSRTKHNTKINH